MGIPKFFKWLTRRYPMILQNVKCVEDVPPSDCLYLDLNSIVHNSIHGNDPKRMERISKLANFEEVWADIMRAIDEIVHMVKPGKLILLALDGVAPRAKMNQQRARRFNSSKQAQDLHNQMLAMGRDIPKYFDSNQISPGTDFMYNLGKQLEWFVKFKLNTDPLYQNCERVVLSDTSVPGEGEHKMLDYIRNLKMSEDYDPNTRHCFYGSDADLIMLSLLTHEPHFTIIREEHVINKTKQGGVQRIDIARTNNLQLIHISLLREYFMLEYREIAGQMKIRFDLERIIDDFIFFCFFIGNDFLPALSALDISEGSLDHLITFYKKCLPVMTDYITDEGQIYWDRAEPFIALLGKYEHQTFINRVKTLDSQYTNAKNLITFSQNDLQEAPKSKEMSKDMLAKVMKEQMGIKIKQKKKDKCAKLFQKNNSKQYKKKILLKKFDEDYEDNHKEGDEFIQYKGFQSKFIKLRQKQFEKDQSDQLPAENEETLHSIISEIREEFFSDLNPDEIPNSEVSEVDDSEIQAEAEKLVDNIQQDQMMANSIDLKKKQQDVFIEQNHQFMTEFVNLYKEDSNEAKRNYYQAKLKFDVKDAKGKIQLHKMLYRYLEGMQWVLYYYYKGARHWRWYYPYHYAPMISDMGSNIVENFLDNKKTITEFRVDINCSSDPKPYSPFQQLLCIFPVKSLEQFLPIQYSNLAKDMLKEYFPESFDIDLNGRTLPWEAAILIPFADEEKFIKAEQYLFDNGMKLSEYHQKRNTISFQYPSYHYDKALASDKSAQRRKLVSTLESMKPLNFDFTAAEYHSEYENVGKSSFSNKLLKGVQCPQYDYPSFQWLNCQDLQWGEKYINKVCFKLSQAKIPQCKEDTNGADFENWIFQFAKQNNRELHVGYPFQYEAFPLYFEDPFSVYQIQGDNNGGFTVQKSRQTRSPDQFKLLCNRIRARFESEGIWCGDQFNTLVTVSRVIGTKYDEQYDEIHKIYSEETETLPFNNIMRKRDPNHYLNVNELTNSRMGRIKANKEAVCLNPELFGVLGKVKGKDPKRCTVKIQIDQEREECKIHNPFLAENFLRKEIKEKGIPSNKPKELTVQEQKEEEKKDAQEDDKEQQIDSKNKEKDKKNEQSGEFESRFYGDQEIENLLKIGYGIVNKITGSHLVAFDQKGKDDRQVVDLGLNIKNFTKKVHIPYFVRFIAPNEGANTIYDEFNHNQHGGRGAKHIRKHWEYSQSCFEIVRKYHELFPEVFVAIKKSQSQRKAMHSLKDTFPTLDKEAAIERIKCITGWIEKLPVSKLPYVEMGFDALDSTLIEGLKNHNNYIQRNYGTVDLKVKQNEFLDLDLVYQETFPFWSSPYSHKSDVTDFKVGNRVLNVNSVMRHYVPFGARGTVIGKTESKIIVMFDEQFLHGNTIYHHCEPYRGAYIDPNYLINLTRSFAVMARKDNKSLRKFQEKPLQDQPAYENKSVSDDTDRRSQYIEEKFNVTYTTEEMSIAQAKPMVMKKMQSEEVKQPTQLKYMPKKTKSINPASVKAAIEKPFIPDKVAANVPTSVLVEVKKEEPTPVIPIEEAKASGQLFAALPGLKGNFQNITSDKIEEKKKEE